MLLRTKPYETNSFTQTLIRAIYLCYHWIVSPVLHLLAGPGNGCRFEPTCSLYAKEAALAHGLGRGVFYALKRVLRCNPWSRGGFDPVPAKKFR